MHRILPKRVAALFVAVLLLLSGAGDAFGVHPCLHHDPSPPAHAPAVHIGGHGHGADHPAPAGEHGACTCQGACQTGAGAALPEPAELRLEAAVVAPAPAPLRGDDLLLPSRPPFFLPYAHAPPLRG